MQRTSALKSWVAACLALVFWTQGIGTAAAAYIFAGGFSETVYGVASYGGPQVFGVPQYIPNAVTGLNSVLVSPGGGFLTADTSNPNNIADTGLVGLPFYSAWIGGGNANGVFGAGEALITPNLVGFSLLDINPDGGGAAAYLVTSSVSTFIDNGAGFPLAVGGDISVGTWLAISGVFGSALSAGAVSLTTWVESANAASPFFGGRSYELVLAAGAIGNFNSVAYADINDGFANSAAVMLNNGVDPFFGLAVNNELLPTAGMMFDTITVKTTLTVIADPQFFLQTIDPTTDLLNAAGPLPDFGIASSTAIVPEPAAAWLLGVGLAGLIGFGRRRKL